VSRNRTRAWPLQLLHRGEMADPLPILRGNLELLVLKALSVSSMHGYAITDWLERRAGGNLELLDSALYQALYRLEGRRLIKATWGLTENSRRARFYSLTDVGRATLRAEVSQWNRYTKTVSGILATPA
jgi:PadR family transcriptional regulator, regulatory protein PadR